MEPHNAALETEWTGRQNSQIEITEITELMTKIHLAFYGSLSSEMSQSEERRGECSVGGVVSPSH